MNASLTRSGIYVLLAGLGFVAVGAVSATWFLITVGALLISALLTLHLIFIPYAVVLRRRHLEFAWWVPAPSGERGAIEATRSVALKLLLRNRSLLSLEIAGAKVFASSAIEIGADGLALSVPRHSEVEFSVPIIPRAAGHWFFHGLSMRVQDPLGLFALHIYYPNLMRITVLPRLSSLHSGGLVCRPETGALQERSGTRAVRHAGLGTDVREIREHVPGDSFKRIAWKPTARRGKLMVREFDSEIVITHWLLLDISSTMRQPELGRSKLDWGISLCASFAKLALQSGDRVGLLLFDHRVYDQVPPGDGPPQLQRIMERLLGVHSVVDEDLTDLTDAELYAAVATYLMHQEGTRVTQSGPLPKPGDPAWRYLVTGPDGQLFDGEAMEHAARRWLDKTPSGAGAAMRALPLLARDPRQRTLRAFAREVGLELPYREHSFLDGKAHGMADAVSLAAASRRSQFIVLVSDLDELQESAALCAAFAAARRRRHAVNVIAPLSPAFSAAATPTPLDRQVQLVRSVQATQKQRPLRRQIERLGIPVQSATPTAALQFLLRRVARGRARGLLRG